MRAPRKNRLAAVALGLAVGGAWPGVTDAAADTRAADSTAGDTTAADTPAADTPAADTTAADTPAADTTVVFTPFRPDAAVRKLRSFRLERSVDVEALWFGTPDDPSVAPGYQTLADRLRLSPAVRTREVSVGPTPEAVALRGGGSGRTELRLGAQPVGAPGTSGPYTHEVMLSEIDRARIVRGGAAALYGPQAASGAIVVDPAFPVVDDVWSRAFAEEGTDEYQRAGFQVARYLGSDGGFFLTTESRRADGFFDGTKQVDRHFAGRVIGNLRGGFQAEAGYRRYEGDGRFNGFTEATLGSLLAKRTDWHGQLYRAFAPGRGTLAEFVYRDEKLENIGTTSTRTRRYDAPTLRITTDLPDVAGVQWVARAEGTRWRVDEEDVGVDAFWQGAAALRGTLPVGPGAGVTGTARVDGEEGRRRAVQGRTEGWWTQGPLRVFGIASHNEQFPERGAVGDQNEIHRSAEVALVFGRGGFRARVDGFVTRINDRRRDPTIEELRAREPVLDAPVGNAQIEGVTAGVTTGFFHFPGVRFLGAASIRTSVTFQDARELASDLPLPQRPRRTWTGEGSLERMLFQDSLLARVRGRLTHWGDRVDAAGAPVVDLWLTDVLLEGEIGDATFFYRFHDGLNRADEVEPGIRFAGFSRTYGISWRFRG